MFICFLSSINDLSLFFSFSTFFCASNNNLFTNIILLPALWNFFTLSFSFFNSSNFFALVPSKNVFTSFISVTVKCAKSIVFNCESTAFSINDVIFVFP